MRRLLRSWGRAEKCMPPSRHVRTSRIAYDSASYARALQVALIGFAVIRSATLGAPTSGYEFQLVE